MYYVGIDLHRNYCVAAMLDRYGRRISEERLPNEEAVIRAFLRETDGPVQAALESTGNWYWLYDLLDGEGVDARLAHPKRVKAIAAARLKNDKVDARMLAHLLRTNLLPESYVPPGEIRELRALVRHRAALVKLQTGLKNRIRALLARRNLTLRSRSLTTRGARAELNALPLPITARQELEQWLELLDHLAACVAELDSEIRQRAGESPEAKLLMSVPGVGYYLALLILSEVGELGRFPSARKLASYAGLVPTTRSSGGRTYHGRITKQGSRWLRWALIEATIHAVRRPGPLQRFYRKQLARKGKKIARVAAARKLLTQIYWVLRNRESYDVTVRRARTAEASSQVGMA